MVAVAVLLAPRCARGDVVGYVVKDFALAAPATAWVRGCRVVGGACYFNLDRYANIGVPIDQGVTEVWKTDGTPAGSTQLHVGRGASFVGVRDTVYFATPADGADFENGVELWATDGTSAGTVRVTNLDTPDVVAVGDELYFARDGALWHGDGSNSGTVRIATVATPRFLLVSGRTVFYRTAGELWRSDGTAGGTVRLASVPEGFMIDAAGTHFFAGDNGLWRTDGTVAGTMRLTTARVDAPRAVGPLLFFHVNGRVWRSDGTAAGTFEVFGSRTDSSVRSAGDTALFFAEGNLWRSDGTLAGTVLVKGIDMRTLFSWGELGGKLVFTVNWPDPFASNPPAALWITDGTTDGTVQLAVWSTRDAARVLATIPGVGVVFQVGPVSTGWGSRGPISRFTGALWVTDGTSTGTRAITEHYHFQAQPGAYLNGLLLFAAYEGHGFDASSLRAVTIATVCGDGVATPDEACDDGNRIDDDCCSNGCTPAPAGRTCDDGDVCTVDTCDEAGRCGRPIACTDTACPEGGEALVRVLSADVTGPCVGRRRLVAPLDGALRHATRVVGAKRRRAMRLLARADTVLARGERRVKRAGDGGTCGPQLASRYRDARRLVGCLLGGF